MAYPTEEDIYKRICWSADVPDLATLLVCLNEAPKLKRVKIDRLFVAKSGYSVFQSLESRGVDVFYDAKLIEIPSKLAALAEVECSHNPWMLNCMAGSVSGGPLEDDDPEKIEGLKRFADACRAADVNPCAVTVLTSKKPELVDNEFNGRTSDEQVLFYVEKLLECGFTDVVCSPNEVPVIRAESRFDDLSLNTPGIKRGEGGSVDQARTNTPAGAFHAGSDMLIIGRDLTKGNPAENLDAIVTEVLATT